MPAGGAQPLFLPSKGAEPPPGERMSEGMVTLDGDSLTLEQVGRIVLGGEKIEASADCLKKVKASRQAVDNIVEQGKTVYGITTGFGKFSSVRIDPEASDELQLNLIHSHSCGVGEIFEEKISRAMMLLRANQLLKGYSGVSIPVISLMIELLNRGITAVVPQQGSLGASGDLVPLAHMTLPLIGEGEVFYHGERRPAAGVLRAEGLRPVTLRAKDGLACINGTPAMTSVGVLSYLEAEKLAYEAELVASLSFEALRGVIDAYDEDVQTVRGFPEQTGVARRMRKILEGSHLVTKQGELRVQDAYTLRCIPQVLGACWQVLNYVREKLGIELNAATDNPLIFDGGEKVISGGNFHGEPVAFAMDFMKIGVAELADMSERRLERLINQQLSGDLPPFLCVNPGYESGVMIMQYTAASLVSENKTLAHPASVDSIPSSANQEDHVSMGTIGARHARQIVKNARNVIAIELICAAQAMEFRDQSKLAPRTKALYDAVRAIVAPITKDRIYSTDISNVSEWMRDGDWKDLFVE